MGIFTPGGAGSPGGGAVGSSSGVTTVQITVGTSETSYALPAETQKLYVRAQGNAKLLISYVSAGSTFTIMPGNIYYREELDSGTSFTIYLTSNKAGTTVEIETWQI